MSDLSPTQFTRESAERIARVVRRVEAGTPQAKPLTFDLVMPTSGNRKTFRMATFSGAWARGGGKVVTFRGSTTTANATNLLLDVPSAGTRNCAIAKDGTEWYLVFPQVRTRNVTLATGTANQSVVTSVPTANQSVLTGMNISASLNTANCSISISQTPQSTNVRVLTGSPQTANVIVQTGTYTATIITLESL